MKNKTKKTLQGIGTVDEQGNIQLSVKPKIMKLALMGGGALLLLQFLPGIIATFSMLAVAGTVVVVSGGAYYLLRNDDFRRGLSIWAKTNTRKLSERAFKIKPLELVEHVMAEQEGSYKEIGQNKLELQKALAVVNDKIVHAKEQQATKEANILEARERNFSEAVISTHAIELGEIMKKIDFLQDHSKRIEITISDIEAVEEAAKYKLDRTMNQLSEMKDKSEIVEVTHSALLSANKILNMDNRDTDLAKAMSDFRDDVAGKVAEITAFGQASRPFVEQVALDKSVATRRALAAIGDISDVHSRQLLDKNKEIPAVE